MQACQLSRVSLPVLGSPIKNDRPEGGKQEEKNLHSIHTPLDIGEPVGTSTWSFSCLQKLLFNFDSPRPLPFPGKS